MLPSTLVCNHGHSITCGVAVLTTDDYFPLGDEPQLEKQTAMDTPDHPGAAAGALYNRGNTRWAGRWTRVIDFTDSALDTAIDGWEAMTPEGKAQAFVPYHIEQVPDGDTACAWNGASFPRCNIQVSGTSDGPFAIFQYSTTMTKASA